MANITVVRLRWVVESIIYAAENEGQGTDDAAGGSDTSNV